MIMDQNNICSHKNTFSDTEQFWMDIKCDEQRTDSAPLCQYGIVATTTTTTTQPPTTTTTEQMTTTSQKVQGVPEN